MSATLRKDENMPQMMLVTQKMYIGIGCANVATRGEELWLSLAKNIGVANAVAAL